MGGLANWIGPLAWAWVIVLGIGIIITPRGPVCTVCGVGGNIAIGVIAVVLGALAFVVRYTAVG